VARVTSVNLPPWIHTRHQGDEQRAEQDAAGGKLGHRGHGLEAASLTAVPSSPWLSLGRTACRAAGAGDRAGAMCSGIH
jgi:hypothetical protein